MSIILLTPRRIIHKYIYLIYGCIIIAVTLPFFGEKIAGTYRLINFGLPFGLQPSEIAKWVIVIALARYLSDHNLKIQNFDAIVVPFLIVLFPTMIVLSQPDLGTAFVMIIPVFTMLFWVGSRPIAAIEPPELLRVYQRIEKRGALETAHRIHQIASRIFRYGVATGRCTRDPTSDLRGALPPTRSVHFATITNLKVGRTIHKRVRMPAGRGIHGFR